MSASGNEDGDEDNFDKHQMVPVIHKYRKLIGGVAPTSNQEEINASLPHADELYTEVIKHKSTRGAHLDAIFLRKASAATYQNSRNINVDNRFEPLEFSQKLVTRLAGRRQNVGAEVDIKIESWLELGSQISGCFKRAVPFHFMLGSFDRGPRVVKKSRPEMRRPLQEEAGPATIPKAISTTGKSQQEVTTEEVERVLSVLKQVTNMNSDGETSPVGFYEFVVDPASFSHTIENIFHLSFLIKDGYACVELDDDQLPVIYPSQPYNQAEHREKVSRKQLVLSMSLEEWKQIIDAFEIEMAMIPKTSAKGPSKAKKDRR